MKKLSFNPGASSSPFLSEGGGSAPDPPPKTGGILIVEDFPVLAAALAHLLSEHKLDRDLTTAASLSRAREQIAARRPSLVLVDISLRHNEGPTFIRETHTAYPDLAILCLSLHDDVFFAELCFQAGARGYVTKADTPEEVVRGINTVLEGHYFVSESVKRRENLSLREDGPPVIRKVEEVLTPREMTVLRQIGEGRGSAEIARSLKLSRKTVQIEQVAIKRKLNLRSAFELTQLAVRMFDKKLSYR